MSALFAENTNLHAQVAHPQSIGASAQTTDTHPEAYFRQGYFWPNNLHYSTRLHAIGFQRNTRENMSADRRNFLPRSGRPRYGDNNQRILCVLENLFAAISVCADVDRKIHVGKSHQVTCRELQHLHLLPPVPCLKGDFSFSRST